MTHPTLSRPPVGESPWFAVEYEPAEHQLFMLDQRKLPQSIEYHRLRTIDEVATAIRDMVVRGAPAIGIAAAYGLVLLARQTRGDARAFLLANGIGSRGLLETRPTAVNLAWAVARMGRRAASIAEKPWEERAQELLLEAEAIHREDLLACRAMGKLGAEDVPEGATIMTHCNAGALATGGYGTALGVIRAAKELGKSIRVLAGETRPFLQGARLTAWELQQDGIEVDVITDSMAGHFLKRGEVQFVVVGSDRIARNGDVANKIGTYPLAVLAKHHEVPFTVAAPWSTVDLDTASGAEITIEERPSDEVGHVGGVDMVPRGVRCRHPAFDVTPASLVEVVYTERGAFRPARGEAPSVLTGDAARAVGG